VFVEPEQRPIGVVFQDYVLFEQMNVLENVAFGLRARGMPKREARAQAARAGLERVGLAEFARSQRRPGAVGWPGAAGRPGPSAGGGARAMLLLDEPLAALDVGTRATTCGGTCAGSSARLRRHARSSSPTTPSTRMRWPIGWRSSRTAEIVQSGTLAEVTAHPRSRYVADLVGTNLVRGVVADGVLTTDRGARLAVAADPGPVFAAIRPQAITLSLTTDATSSARNVLAGIVGDIDRLGDRARVGVDGPVPRRRRDHDRRRRRAPPATGRPGLRVRQGDRHHDVSGMTRDELLLGEWACLGVLYAERAHGFAVAAELRPDQPIGRIWSLSRPLTYRALDQLVERGLVAPVGSEPSTAGPNRIVLAATRRGRARLRTWVRTPVVHLRDLRSELLLKLTLAERCDIDVADMLVEQRRRLDAQAGSLAAAAFDRDGVVVDAVALWRHEVASAAQRFLDRLEDGTGT
jgi:molybdate transport system ATP-binding protein